MNRIRSVLRHGTTSRRVLCCLAVSTATVAAAGALTATWSSGAGALFLPLVQVATFGSLWVVQFVVLDRVVFATPPAPHRDLVSSSENELAA